jgi:hypothetical protein
MLLTGHYIFMNPVVATLQGYIFESKAAEAT